MTSALMDDRPVLSLLSGLPCSGKTTYARSLEGSRVRRVSVDDLMIATHGRLGADYDASTHLDRLGPVVDQAQRLVTGHLTAGSSVVLDHGLGMRAERDDWKQIADAAGARWELIRFDVDIATLRARCALRSLSPGAVPIADTLLREMASSWEPPAGEGERIVEGVGDWVQDFYSITDRWWGNAEAQVETIDRDRAGWIADLVDHPFGRTVLELGCGSGGTAHATSDLGFAVTGIDFSDRIDRAPTEVAEFVRADFLRYEFDQRFDVVSYWDGFGVGTDNEQLTLLDRIATNLVAPDGHVIIEVFDPTGFTRDDGLIEHRPASPERGYPFALDQARTYDPITHRAVDAWKDRSDDTIWSQSLRCYSPTEFAELVAASQLELVHVLDEGASDWSYIAVLQPGASSTA